MIEQQFPATISALESALAPLTASADSFNTPTNIELILQSVRHGLYRLSQGVPNSLKFIVSAKYALEQLVLQIPKILESLAAVKAAYDIDITMRQRRQRRRRRHQAKKRAARP